MERILDASKPSKITMKTNGGTYSLVSCGKVTPETLQVWAKLPDEEKYAPEFDKFRKLYEETGQEELQPLIQKGDSEINSIRLPIVKSVPLLNGKNNSSNEEINIENGETKCNETAEVQTLDAKDDVRVQPPFNSLQKTIRNAKHYTKITLLLGCWTFFTVVFLMYSEKKEVIKNTAISPGGVKNYTFNTSCAESILVKVSGPFLSEQAEIKMNSSELKTKGRMIVWLERRTTTLDRRGVESFRPEENETNFRTIILQDHDQDFNEGEARTLLFRLEQPRNDTTYGVRMMTTSNQTVAFSVSFTFNPMDVRTGVMYACILLCGLYALIVFEVINRTMAAIVVATASIAALALVGERPSLPELVSWLDVETLLLLFSMMLLVTIMSDTGIFDFLAVFTFEVTRGKLWPLIILLCTITAVLSTFLDNVTTVLLMSPVTIRLCKVMDLDPVPILMFMAIYSNIGGTATPVGDPPNVIVASNKAVIQAGINFTNFTAHMALGILFIFVQTTLQIRFMYRDSNQFRLKEPQEIQDLRHQISISRQAENLLSQQSKDIKGEKLEEINKLTLQLNKMMRDSSKRACPKDTFKTTLLELKEKHKIRDKMLLMKTSVAIAFVVVVFFLHSIPEFNRISLSWTALLGAILLLILIDREKLEPVLNRIEWSTLLFFAALFVLMEALSKLGLILYIGGLMEQLIIKVDESSRLAVALMLILWVSGIISAFVDNIPLTTMMVRVVVSIGSNPNINLPMAPLIWALLLGACLGGNGTLIGASANVMCAGVAEQHGYRFTFMRFFMVGFPVMIGHLITSSVYLLICHCVFAWH